MSEVRLTVHPFRIGTDKEAALKPLEEAAEAFGAWQDLDELYSDPSIAYGDSARAEEWRRAFLADEIADCIQACCNLANRYGIDLQAAMERCEKRNRDRGRC